MESLGTRLDTVFPPLQANSTLAARARSGAAESTFKYVEILKTRRKPNHSHPEVEILLVLNGQGTRIIGESIGEFREGDLYVLGSQLLHTFFPSPSDHEPVKTLVIQFHPGDLRPALAVFPEFQGFDDFLAKARRGLSVSNATRESVSALMHRIGGYPPRSPKRISLFMAILAELSESDDLAVAGGPKLLPLRNGRMDGKLDIVCRLIQNNLANPLAQAAMAGRVGMSPAAFSRWFKRNMGRIYTDYVNESRIDMVGQALYESNRDISRISRDFGFSGGAHFHRLFKSIKGIAPSEYRRLSRLAPTVPSASLQ